MFTLLVLRVLCSWTTKLYICFIKIVPKDQESTRLRSNSFEPQTTSTWLTPMPPCLREKCVCKESPLTVNEILSTCQPHWEPFRTSIESQLKSECKTAASVRCVSTTKALFSQAKLSSRNGTDEMRTIFFYICSWVQSTRLTNRTTIQT